MATLDRDGVAIAYEVEGTGDGAPLLLTHGYGATRRMWDPNLAAVSGERRVARWDMRGHGESAAPDDPALYGHHACVGDMAAVLDRAGAERAVLCGMSLGGFLSLAFHLAHPDRVLALVLVDTGPGFRNHEARERWNAWALDRADRLEREGVAALPGSREQVGDDHLHGAQGLAHAARGMLVQHDGAVLDSLATISVPTLVLVGSEDEQFLAAADVMERRIPQAHKLVLEGAGHAANLDAPDRFNAALNHFLEGL